MACVHRVSLFMTRPGFTSAYEIECSESRTQSMEGGCGTEISHLHGVSPLRFLHPPEVQVVSLCRLRRTGAEHRVVPCE